MEIFKSICPCHNKEYLIEVRSTIKDHEGNLVCIEPFCSHGKTKQETHAMVYAKIVSRYSLIYEQYTGNSVVYKVNAEKMFYQWFIEYYVPKSTVRLNALTNQKNPLVPGSVNLARFVPDLTRKVDAYIEQNQCSKFPPGSLRALCRVHTSIEEILVKKVNYNGKEYPRLIFTSNFYTSREEKVLYLMKDFSFDTADRRYLTAVRNFITPALRMLEYKLRSDKYIGKLDFQYSPRENINRIKMLTSGGFINAKKSNFYCDGVAVKVMASGKKVYLFEASTRKLHRFMIDLAMEMDPRFQTYCITKVKGEPRYHFFKQFSGLDKFLVKGREFFIPELCLTILSDMMHKKRMLFERGDVITIGVKPWYGGWYDLAVKMNYNNPEIFWVDGDITALDKHIQDWMLYLYLARGARYYNWSGMNRVQRRVLKKLYAILMYHVTNKITLHVGTIWRLIRGVMYSGGKETSHGDSWIMALIFYVYVFYKMYEYPHAAPFIYSALLSDFIAIIVYGDDHIWCALKCFRHILNAHSFHEFLRDKFGMELRDFKEYDEFLSVPDYGNGTLTYAGPKFLKRYFVENFLPGAAPVLPYKPYFESTLRLCTVKEEEDFPGLYLKAIGQAWDTTGTNTFMYGVARYVYDYASAHSSKTPAEIVQEWSLDPSKAEIMRSMSKKAMMPRDAFINGFPTLEELQSRHVYNPDSNGNKPDLEPMFGW